MALLDGPIIIIITNIDSSLLPFLSLIVKLGSLLYHSPGNNYQFTSSIVLTIDARSTMEEEESDSESQELHLITCDDDSDKQTTPSPRKGEITSRVTRHVLSEVKKTSMSLIIVKGRAPYLQACHVIFYANHRYKCLSRKEKGQDYIHQ